jgi:hypothetical protein
MKPGWLGTPALQLVLLSAPATWAGDVEVSPFVGMQYGGSLSSPSGHEVAIDVGLQYGATLDVGIAGRWSIELLVSRQETELAGAPRVGLAIERYLAGVREEKEVGRFRFLGVFLLGLTRFVPDGRDADERFTGALGLGLRRPLTRRLWLRADVRAYYAVVSSGGATACIDGSCLFVFGGTGIWQGDLTAAATWTF